MASTLGREVHPQKLETNPYLYSNANSNFLVFRSRVLYGAVVGTMSAAQSMQSRRVSLQTQCSFVGSTWIRTRCAAHQVSVATYTVFINSSGGKRGTATASRILVITPVPVKGTPFHHVVAVMLHWRPGRFPDCSHLYGRGWDARKRTSVFPAFIRFLKMPLPTSADTRRQQPFQPPSICAVTYLVFRRASGTVDE